MNCLVLFIFLILVHTAWSGLRIIGGNDVAESEYPYIVRLESVSVKDALNPSVKKNMQNVHVCTGSVLAEKWTLTAGHCVNRLVSYPPKKNGVERKNFVRIGRSGDNTTTPEAIEGERPTSTPTPPVHEATDGGNDHTPHDSNINQDQLVEILATCTHPAFKDLSFGDSIHMENDVGLVNTKPIFLPNYVKVSAVDFSTLIGQEAKTVGFGTSEPIKMKDGTIVSRRKPLQSLDVILVECPKDGRMYPALCVASRCSGSKNRPVLCAGDSGGPLLHPAGIIAITGKNYEKDCRLKDSSRRRAEVGTLTPISPYLTWITSHIIKGR